MPNSLKEVETTIPEIPAVIKVPVTDEVGNTVGAITPVERGNIDAIRAQLDVDLKKTYKNISIERARMSDGNFMPTYNITVVANDDLTSIRLYSISFRTSGI